MDDLFYNPIKELFEEEINSKIHLYVKQRSGRKRITFLGGLHGDDIDKICKEWRKCFSCSCIVIKKHPTYGETVVQLSGDQRENIKEWLIKYRDYEKGNIITHGY